MVNNDRFSIINFLGGKMIFEYKLSELRKKKGWTQEELAEKMDVTRQSVSKWEGGQSIPDIEKVVKLSELFGVSIDYLLKENVSIKADDNNIYLKRLSISEVNEYLKIKISISKSIAFATFLCVLSPLTLIILGTASDKGLYGIKENEAAGIGVIVTLILVGIAVMIFTNSNSKIFPYKYIEKGCFTIDNSVKEMVKSRRDKYRTTYTRGMNTGIFVCIVSAIPFFLGVIINENNDLLLVLLLSFSFLIAGIGIIFIIKSSKTLSGFEFILKEESTHKLNKDKKNDKDISGPYWGIVIAVFLTYAFLSKDWRNSWLIILLARLLYPSVYAVIKYLFNIKKTKQE